MEMPHLKLYLRRVLASPKGLPLREALRTARVRALLGVLGWSLASVLYMLVFEAALDKRGGGLLQWATPSSTSYFHSLAVLVGVWYILYGCGELMGVLLGEPRLGQLDWHLAPLTSFEALAGILLAALASALPGLGGLGIFVAFSNGLDFDWSGTLPYFSGGCLWQFMLRLPLYCLFTGGLMLALRGLAAVRLLPWLISIAACIGLLWRYDPAISRTGWLRNAQDLPVMPTFGAALLAAAFLVLLGLLLHQLSRREQVSASWGWLLALVLIPPIALGASTIAAGIDSKVSSLNYGRSSASGSGPYTYQAIQARQSAYRLGLGSSLKPAFLTLGLAYPTILMGKWPRYRLSNLREDDTTNAPREVAWAMAALSLLALPMWFRVCTACLEARRL